MMSQRSKTLLDSALTLLNGLAQSIPSRFGPDDSLLGEVHHQLAAGYRQRGDGDQARVANERAAEIWRKAGDRHRLLLLRELGLTSGIAIDAFDLVAREKASDQRFEILRGMGDSPSREERRHLVLALWDRGALRAEQGRYDDAIRDLREGLEQVNSGVVDSVLLSARLFLSLGIAIASQGRFAEAEGYYLTALHLHRDLNPGGSESELSVLVGLSNVVSHRADPSQAEQWVDSARELATRLGSKGFALQGLNRTAARVAAARGDFESALEQAERGIEYGRSHGARALRSHQWNLDLGAHLAFVAGKTDLGRRWSDELIGIRRGLLTSVFAYASETQKLRYLQTFPAVLSSYLNAGVTLQERSLDRGIADMLSGSKALVLDVMAAENSLAACTADPTLDSLLDRRKSVCSEIAEYALSGHSPVGGPTRLGQLYAAKDQIDRDLSDRCAFLSRNTEVDSVFASALAARLPNGSVLWEFARFRRHRLTYESMSGGDFLGDWYAAVTLTPHDEVGLVDLGPASVIDSLIGQFRSALADGLYEELAGPSGASSTRWSRLQAALHSAVIAPLEESLAGVERVYIAADGALCLLPFEVVMQPDERYLLEDYEFAYLTSGRDLLETAADGPGREAIVIANPDFMVTPQPASVFAATDITSSLSFRGESEAPECLRNMFAPLPATAQEGESVALLLEQRDFGVVRYEAGQAQEAHLKEVPRAPGVLHIATHGYFCSEVDRGTLANPLLRSGLILAGANQTIGGMGAAGGGDEDGILTALEVSSLNLIGTELVVLSACQTGLGDLQSGEGVFGLRRAFQQAGARSMLMSMFEVPDESTAALMTAFYSRWLAGEPKVAALRNAALQILETRRAAGRSTHPVHWGSFVLVGDAE